METHTEIIKERLKEITVDIEKTEIEINTIGKTIYPQPKYPIDFPIYMGKLREDQAFLLGMQTAIKSELEFLESFNENTTVKKSAWMQLQIIPRITDCKDALKLLGVKK